MFQNFFRLTWKTKSFCHTVQSKDDISGCHLFVTDKEKDKGSISRYHHIKEYCRCEYRLPVMLGRFKHIFKLTRA